MSLSASSQEIDGGIRQRRPTSGATTTASSSPSPVLVVGATGRVGRRVVEQLLLQNRPVRALVRNPTKAQELFGKNGSSKSSMHPNLQIVVAEISQFEDFGEVLDKAVEGCGSIISVSGAMRVSHLSDFLPWRLFGADVSSWAGRDHPYYASYASQKHVIELAAKHKV
jgi:nucleoside-diphosphate-sugar epimerase